ncbi:MAG: hypothetical protein H6706_11515 [Myxococcales bacterium]|nr:hypothetical protein [Myxococcales bacterium]
MIQRSGARRLAGLLLLLAGLAGCDDTPAGSGAGCVEDRECDLPYSCIEGRCIEECRRHADCARGEVCYESVCYAPVEFCRIDAECAPFGQVCDVTIGRCVPTGGALCHPTLNPCPEGQTCRDGACVLPTDDASRPDATVRDATVRDAAVRDAAVRDARPPERDQGVVDARVPPPDRGVDPPDAAVAGDGRYGDACRCGSDCASGFCVENKLFNTRTCTDRCGNDGECPGLDTCLPVQSAGPSAECPGNPNGPPPGEVVSVCIPNDTGYPCQLEAAQNPCLSGVCLRPPQPVNWFTVQDQCAMFCQDDRKCPHGHSCQQIQGVRGRVCAPATEMFACPDGTIQACGGVCPAAAGRAPEDVSVCLALGAGPGYCSCTCDRASDCPTGYACSRLDGLNTGDPGRSGVCLAMAGYRCAGEAARPNTPQCPSLTCALDDAEPNAAVCTAPCNREADCPPNFACQPVDGSPQGYCIAFE